MGKKNGNEQYSIYIFKKINEISSWHCSLDQFGFPNSNTIHHFSWEKKSEFNNIPPVPSRKIPLDTAVLISLVFSILIKFINFHGCSLDQFGFFSTNKIHHFSWEKKIEINNILSVSSRKLMKFPHNTVVLINLIEAFEMESESILIDP